jgi:hypothetical protein
MTHSLLPLLRQAAACLAVSPCTFSSRFAIVGAIATTIASSH